MRLSFGVPGDRVPVHRFVRVPFINAVLFACALAALLVLTRRERCSPFVAIVVVGTGFGLAAGLSISQIGKSFGLGFSQSLAGAGLVLVAVALMSEFAAAGGAGGWLRDRVGRLPTAFRRWCVVPAGLLAGLGAVPEAAYAALLPWHAALGARSSAGSATVAVVGPPGSPVSSDSAGQGVSLGLALAAGHGLLWPSPVVIAAAAILHADPVRLLQIGVPVALIAAFLGAAWSRVGPAIRPVATSWGFEIPDAPAGTLPGMPALAPAVAPADVRAGSSAPARAALLLALATVVLIGLTIVQSIGNLPSEPLGGGPVRELLLGVGRPFAMLVVGVGLMAIGLARRDAATWSAQGLAGQGIARVAGLLLLIGAAGGLQTLTQQTGMAELLTERMLGWPIGLWLPFAAAVAMKLLQGSSLVAVITAAGMVEPLLPALGLDLPTGRALAVLALGAGAVAGSHVNDPYFWLVGTTNRLGPGSTLLRLTGGLLLQGIIAVALLSLVGAWWAQGL